ncbi:Cytochrome c oxidase assembly factor 7, partial [Goodea atripinnis]
LDQSLSVSLSPACPDTAERSDNMAGLINFEDENEVKQFLDNLGVEYSFQCYKEKDPEGNRRTLRLTVRCFFSGCQRLADYLEGVKKNFDSAAQVLKHNCETNGHSESCYKIGAYHVTGKGGKKSIDACHNVGLLAHDGRALEGGPDVAVAQEYYEKACAGGFAPSCFNLSALFIEGNSKGLTPNMSQAFRYANRACELGHVWGCANASRMCRIGDGTEKDEKKAEELKNRARELHGLEKERQLKFGE